MKSKKEIEEELDRMGINPATAKQGNLVNSKTWIEGYRAAFEWVLKD